MRSETSPHGRCFPGIGSRDKAAPTLDSPRGRCYEDERMPLRSFALQCNGPKNFGKPSKAARVAIKRESFETFEDTDDCKRPRRALEYIHPRPRHASGARSTARPRVSNERERRPHIWDTVLYCRADRIEARW